MNATLIQLPKKHTEEVIKGAGISTKFTGKMCIYDQSSGVYWETLPNLSSEETTLQTALINWRGEKNPPAKKITLKEKLFSLWDQMKKA